MKLDQTTLQFFINKYSPDIEMNFSLLSGYVCLEFIICEDSKQPLIFTLILERHEVESYLEVMQIVKQNGSDQIEIEFSEESDEVLNDYLSEYKSEILFEYVDSIELLHE